MQNFEEYEEKNKKHIINLLIQKRGLFTNKSFPQAMDYKLILNDNNTAIYQYMLNSYNMIGRTV